MLDVEQALEIFSKFKTLHVKERAYFISGTNYTVILFLSGAEIYVTRTNEDEHLLRAGDGFRKLGDIWDKLPEEFRFEAAFHLDLFA